MSVSTSVFKRLAFVIVAAGLTAAGLMSTVRGERYELDIHSGQRRITTTFLWLTVQREVSQTEFSTLYQGLGGTEISPPDWRFCYEGGYNMFGQRTLYVCITSNNPGEVYTQVATLIHSLPTGCTPLKLSDEGRLALMQRVMQSFEPKQGSGGQEYWDRVRLFIQCHPCVDDPWAPALGPKDFPTPKQALDDEVWKRDWVPIVDSHGLNSNGVKAEG